MDICGLCWAQRTFQRVEHYPLTLEGGWGASISLIQGAAADMGLHLYYWTSTEFKED